jgi:hypothetical protein
VDAGDHRQGCVRQKEVASQYSATLLADVKRLRVYAWLCKQLRNHIHDGILAVDPHPGRSYGSSKNVALNLGRIPELIPGADNYMTQAHYDALGVWQTEPVSYFGGSSMVADLATTGFTLMRTGLELRRSLHEADRPEQAAEKARC